MHVRGRARLIATAILIASCGGPSVPSEVPSRSPLSPDAEPAPLPVVGASLEERPLEPAGVHGHAHSH